MTLLTEGETQREREVERERETHRERGKNTRRERGRNVASKKIKINWDGCEKIRATERADRGKRGKPDRG